MSEFDSLSDSDWLDISSNGRGDSDNDSIASQDSDRDDHLNSRPISRLSSFSNASSVNGEVDAWEGLLSDGGDDAAGLPHGTYPPLPSSTAALQLAPSLGTLEDPIQSGNDVKEAHDDEDEDERVRMALDQSFVGTLNASRTSALTHSFGSGSVPTPIRDIRLSFPDPLTSSSPDKLNLSFEALSSTEAGDTSLSNGSDTSSSTTYDNSMVLPSLPPQDPGRVISTHAVRHHEAQLSGSVEQSELEIVLYGSSSTAKWRFVQELIGKAASYAGYALDAAVLQDTPERQATVHLTKQSEEALPFFDTVVVLDKTTDSEKAAQSAAIESINRPSLAVVFLPVAKLPALAWHTSYLPVVVPSDPEEKGTMLAVEDDWDLLGVPQYRTSRLALGSSRFFDSQQSQTIVGGRAYQLLHGLSDEVEEPTPKPLTEHLKSVNTVKLVALMSLFVGFAVNTAFPSTAPAPTPTINRATTTNIWRILAEQNQSILPQTRGGTSNSQTLMSGSVILSDVSLSLFNPGTTALSVPPPPEAKSISLTASASSKALSEVPTTTPCTQCQVSGPTTALAEPSSSLSIIKTPSSDVVLLRPAVTPLSASGAKGDKAKAEDVQLKTPMSPMTQSKALSAAGSDAPVAGPSKPRASPVASPSSMPSSSSAPFNAKEAVVSTVSDAFDTSAKVFSDVVNSVGAIIPDGLDAELLEATNVLYSSLITQTDKVVKNWNSNKGKAKERLETANGRAKKNAKKIKEKGSEFLWSAGQQFVDKTKRARKNAKEVWGMATGVNDGENGDGFDDDAGENWVEWDSGSPSLARKQMRKMRRDARRAAREAEGGKENAVPWTSGGGRESGESGCPRRRSGQAPCAAAGDFAQGMWFQFGF